METERLVQALSQIGSINEQERHLGQAAIEMYEKDKEYPLALLYLGATLPQVSMKLTSLICLKNYVSSIFSGQRRGFRKDCTLLFTSSSY